MITKFINGPGSSRTHQDRPMKKSHNNNSNNTTGATQTKRMTDWSLGYDEHGGRWVVGNGQLCACSTTEWVVVVGWRQQWRWHSLQFCGEPKPVVHCPLMQLTNIRVWFNKTKMAQWLSPAGLKLSTGKSWEFTWQTGEWMHFSCAEIQRNRGQPARSCV